MSLFGGTADLESHEYIVCFQDEEIFSIDRNEGIVHIFNENKLPFDIYLEESDDFSDRINNIQNFNSWCSERMLSLDRKYAKEICNCLGIPQPFSDKERATIVIALRGLSINDCFWIKKSGEKISWSQVNLFDNSLKNHVLEVALFGISPTITNQSLISPDISTAGAAPKAWRRTDSGFELLKGNVNGSVKREVEASQMLQAIGIDVVNYHRSIFKSKLVSVCDCYTSKEVCFARAKYVDIWCMNHDIDFADIIYKHKLRFDMMNLADYLVGNSDEHSENWGIIYDNEFNIINISPIMDFDHAFEAGPQFICQPAQYLGMQISLQDYALSVIDNYADIINFDVDLSKYKYGDFVKSKLLLLKEHVQ